MNYWKIAFLIIASIFPIVAGGSTGVNLERRADFEEVVQVALFGAAERIEIALSPLPTPSLLELPQCQGELLFGAIPLGNAGTLIPFVVCEGPEGPKIWIDTDGDEQLDGDGWWHWRGGWQEFSWLFTVMVDYLDAEGGSSHKEAYPLWIAAAPAIGRGAREPFWAYTLLPGGYRMGWIKLDGREIRAAIFDLNVDGRFDDLNNLGLVVDTDLDGELCHYCFHETFGRLSPFPEEPIRIGDMVYSLTRAAPSGRWLEFIAVDETIAQVPVLLPGHPFPELEAKTLWGEDFALANFKGEVIALFLLPHVLCAEKSHPQYQCDEAFQAACSRPLEVARLLAAIVPEARVVVVLIDDKPPTPREWEEAKQLGVSVLWCPWVLKSWGITSSFYTHRSAWHDPLHGRGQEDLHRRTLSSYVV